MLVVVVLNPLTPPVAVAVAQAILIVMVPSVVVISSVLND